jgi:hypothetical protein
LVPFVPVGVELVLIVDGETGLELTDVDVTMKPEPALGMTKGLVDPADLDKAVEQLLQLHGRAWLETDMRAHLNPTRMRSIERATHALARAAHGLCRLCARPGYVPVERVGGLPCADYGEPTNKARANSSLVPAAAKRRSGRLHGLRTRRPTSVRFATHDIDLRIDLYGTTDRGFPTLPRRRLRSQPRAIRTSRRQASTPALRDRYLLRQPHRDHARLRRVPWRGVSHSQHRQPRAPPCAPDEHYHSTSAAIEYAVCVALKSSWTNLLSFPWLRARVDDGSLQVDALDLERGKLLLYGRNGDTFAEV